MSLKLTWSLLLCYFTSWAIVAATPHRANTHAVFGGTIVVVAASQKEIDIAADSRAVVNDTLSGTSYSQDDACKITVLAPDLIFAAAGIGGGGLPSNPIWSATEEARQAFKTIRATQPKSEGSDVNLIADRWATSVKQRLEAQQQSGTTDLIASGIFASARKTFSL